MSRNSQLNNLFNVLNWGYYNLRSNFNKLHLTKPTPNAVKRTLRYLDSKL